MTDPRCSRFYPVLKEATKLLPISPESDWFIILWKVAGKLTRHNALFQVFVHLVFDFLLVYLGECGNFLRRLAGDLWFESRGIVEYAVCLL